MAQRTRAASPRNGGRSPVTSMALAALFALLGVLGLQNGSAQASPGTPTPVAAAHHGPAGPGGVAPARSAAADTRSSTDDACTTDCGQPPRVGRTTQGEWHVPSPGGVPVPPGPGLCLPEPGPQLPLSPGTPASPQPSASHSGRGPPTPTGI